MASNRIGRINEEIQRELSDLIRNLKDPRVQNTMISIKNTVVYNICHHIRLKQVHCHFAYHKKGRKETEKTIFFYT